MKTNIPSLPPLLARVPPIPGVDSDLLLDQFLRYVGEQGLTLYPAQEEAILELYQGKNLILNTPTGSGKSLVATSLHYLALSEGRRSIYTCPIKALVNEKFLHLCREFGAENVGMMTGDASVNRDAKILCCTAEILANWALVEGENLSVGDVIMDEFHYYADRDRGWAWQIPLLILKRTRFLLMSATLGEMSFFAERLSRLNGQETALIQSVDRPVPLEFSYSETPLHETMSDLLAAGKFPIYVVNFSQAASADTAQDLMSTDFCTREEKKQIADELVGVDFKSPYGKELSRYLKHGIGLHHAGLLPRYRILVERLAAKGRLKVISGTDTLGLGINVPIRSVLLTKLCKYDGEKTMILSHRDFHQICGRAGRKGFDDRGYVVAQAPEHVIENLKIERKAQLDPKKAKKIVKQKPPERGYVHWDKNTFEKLQAGKPEPLQSRFQVRHSMVLQVLARPQNGCDDLRDLIRQSHESEAQKKHWRKTAWIQFRALLDRKLLTLENGRVKAHVDLQEDFSIHHALSLYLIDVLTTLDPTAEKYSLDLLTLCESIVENPDLILRRQQERARSLRFAELKSSGMEYEERQEELEKVEYPKPNAEFIYSTFKVFCEAHPWLDDQFIRPKSIARDMFERYASFQEYIREYDLQRVEGLLLRYLSEVYKILVQTVPDQFKTPPVLDMITFFAEVVRGIDSSLVDEWTRLRDLSSGLDSTKVSDTKSEIKSGAISLSEKRSFDLHEFHRRARHRSWQLVRALALVDEEQLAAGIDEYAESWSLARITDVFKEYRTEHRAIVTDTTARYGHWTRLHPDSQNPCVVVVEQTLVDPDGLNDWELVVQVSSVQDAEGRESPVVKWLNFHAIG